MKLTEGVSIKPDQGFEDAWKLPTRANAYLNIGTTIVSIIVVIIIPLSLSSSPRFVAFGSIVSVPIQVRVLAISMIDNSSHIALHGACTSPDG